MIILEVILWSAISNHPKENPNLTNITNGYKYFCCHLNLNVFRLLICVIMLKEQLFSNNRWKFPDQAESRSSKRQKGKRQSWNSCLNAFLMLILMTCLRRSVYLATNAKLLLPNCQYCRTVWPTDYYIALPKVPLSAGKAKPTLPHVVVVVVSLLRHFCFCD